MAESLSPEAVQLLAEVDAVDWASFAEDEGGLERLSWIPDQFRNLMNNGDGSLRRLFDAAELDTSYAGMYRNTHVLLVGFLLRFLELSDCRDANTTLRWLGGVVQGVSYCDPRGVDPPYLVNRLLMEARPLFARLMRDRDTRVRSVAASIFLDLSRPNDYTTPLPMADDLREAAGRDVLNTLAEFEDDDSWRAISLTRFHFVGTAVHVPELVAKFLAKEATPDTQLAAAVAAARLAGSNAPAEVMNHLRAALPKAAADKFAFRFGTEITRKEIPRWVRWAIWHLGPETALPILIDAMKSKEAGSPDAVSDVIEFLRPWHAEDGRDVTWSSLAKYKIAALTPHQRTFMNAVADLPLDREPQSGWAKDLAGSLKQWGLPAEPDKLRKKLSKLPDAEPVPAEPPASSEPLASIPTLGPSEEAVAFHERQARIQSFDWATATDPAAMLDWMRNLDGRWTANRMSHRFAVACCRRIQDRFTTDRAKPILDLIEAILDETDKKVRSKKEERLRGQKFGGGFRPEDGTADDAVWELYAGLYSPLGLVRWPVVLEVVGRVAAAARQVMGKGEAAAQVALLRCIYDHPPTDPPEFDPKWRMETVKILAAGIGAEGAFDRLPVLADALEDAGCDAAELLAHLRGSGPHCRGCWAVDEVLGRR